MRLTKHAHATVTIDRNGTAILIDPGTFTPNVSALMARATVVLITHDHFDHFDVEAVHAALAKQSRLIVYGPESVAEALADTTAASEGRVVPVHDGDLLQVGDIEVKVFAGNHANIHESIPTPRNVGYLIGGIVFHPGDSYAVPPFPVDTLLVPVSGPWVKIGEAIDFITAIAPRQSAQIHDVMLSDIGRSSAAMFLGARGLTGLPMLTLTDGETIDL